MLNFWATEYMEDLLRNQEYVPYIISVMKPVMTVNHQPFFMDNSDEKRINISRNN